MATNVVAPYGGPVNTGKPGIYLVFFQFRFLPMPASRHMPSVHFVCMALPLSERPLTGSTKQNGDAR